MESSSVGFRQAALLSWAKICALFSVCNVCSSHLPFFWGIGGHTKIVLCGFPRITIVIKMLF